MQPPADGPSSLESKVLRPHSGVSAEALTLEYRTANEHVVALSEVSLVVHPGEMVVVRGVSGSGKSSLISVLAGLITPQSGSLSVFGTDVTNSDTDQRATYRRTVVSLIFQELNLVSALRADENIELALSLSGVPRAECSRRAREVAGDLGISDLLSRFPGELSGGQRQRVAVARAIASRKPLVLADEPTGSLDSQTAELVGAALLAARERGAAVILATHDARLAGLGDRVVSMSDGRLSHSDAVPA